MITLIILRVYYYLKLKKQVIEATKHAFSKKKVICAESQM